MNMERQPKEISQELLDSLRECNLVGIHGANGSGKSCLAREIIPQIGGGTHIEVDNFLSNHRERPYLDQIQINELITRVTESTPPIIFDCFIALDVLERINSKAELMLYCERVHLATIRIGKPELNSLFESYRKRRQPEATAKQIFTLNISF
jgi:hypothetical protein